MRLAPVGAGAGISLTTKRPSDVDKHISRRVRERREDLQLTQPDLADRLGITFQQFQKYENGQNRIPAGRLYEIARALRTGVSYFFPGGEASTSVSRGVAEERSEFEGPPGVGDAAELVRVFRSIGDAKVRKSVLAMVRKQAKAAATKRRRRD
jgi:transcriptional regulator with XRE-family HTH domain